MRPELVGGLSQRMVLASRLSAGACGHRSSSDRILLAEPPFNCFPLRGQHNTLPFHGSSVFAVFGHYVGALIQDQDEAVSLCALEAVRGRSLVFLHLFHNSRNLKISLSARSGGPAPTITI